MRTPLYPGHSTRSPQQRDSAAAVQLGGEDTEALIGDLEVPDVQSEIVCGEVSAVVAVHGDGVDVVGVSVGEYSPGHGLHGAVVLDLLGDSELGDGVFFPHHALVRHRVEVTEPPTALRDLPQLYCLVFERGERGREGGRGKEGIDVTHGPD